MPKKSSVISFRVFTELKELLEKEAELKHITTNQLLNNIVRKHTKWDRFAEEVGLVFLSKAVFRNLLSHISDAELKILASTMCRSTMKDATMFQKGRIDFQSLLETVDMWLENSHIPFRRFSNTNEHEKYVIQHDLGMKYSIYLYTAINTLFSEVGVVAKKESLTNQTLDFELVVSKNMGIN